MHRLGIKIEKQLLNEFEEPLHELCKADKEMILFDYPQYFDRYLDSFLDQIKKETKFLMEQKDILKDDEYQGNYFINDYVIEINP